ncbi:hypothetical protein PHSY_006780 [Pseudozyma hubeiensis SY62]|uniref:ER-bound oxygenase mpaB/mpaB'/Rubber oxygenase catalytic domain-containing protein n=1 Tax=Pseudozyma hubeiensis (strain SY62) TaxID=1305764 RepID=R9PM28_PSEHS|nr:hypothetical protein PHSY_006780 [Pseudozyma hubeiensis SY62]GAC99180.1 hypothetical protein PHSY_006780 [Pseudozyma hubeiensis SY62]
MSSSPISQLAADTLAHASEPAVASTAAVALLLLFVPAARKFAINVVCHIYAAIVHRPFRASTTDFFFSSHEAPLPPTHSLWYLVQASTTLKWRAQSNRLRHEKDIRWDDKDAVKHGDMIEAWDRITEWDSQCFHPHKLEQLRKVGDPLADDALDQLENTSADSQSHSSDTLLKIYQQTLAHDASKDQPSACSAFWRAIDRRPPPGSGALGLDWYRSCYGQDAVRDLPQWPRYPSTKQKEPIANLPTWTPQQHAAIDAQDDPAELQAEAEVLRRGQQVFYRYAGPMLTVLLHFSLAGGFASPRITQVLKQTAYLVPNTSVSHANQDASGSSSSLPTVEELRTTFKVDKARADRTWSRLLETTQFILDVVEKVVSLRPPSISAASDPTASKSDSRLAPLERGGEGWQSAVRVRLLHTTVRRRIMKLAEKHGSDPSTSLDNGYDVDTNGIPINQEDMLGTLCAFSSAPLMMMQKIGLQPTSQERKDYIALWRHVGFYMGIEPALLRRAFVDAHAADRTMFCTILHLFKQVEVHTNQSGEHRTTLQPRMQGPTIPVLIACADRPPFHTPLSAHVAISRRLLGKSMADSLALPASSPSREVLTDVLFAGMKMTILFGHLYPRKSWEERKLQLARPLLRRLIVFSFGNKRTKFEMPVPTTSASAETQSTDKGNIETQSHAHPDVPEDKQLITQLAREWRRLMREMYAVLFLVALLSLTPAVYLSLRLFGHYFSS